MAGSLKDFGNTARSLARNPLGIIALFIVLVYGFAALVVGFSSQLQPSDRLPIIWFLVIFPCIVIAVFTFLVTKHHRKLYAPSDYKDEKNFLAIYNPGLSNLKSVDQNAAVMASNSENSNEELQEIRKNIYQSNRGLFIAHLLEPSENDAQEYNIFIFLKRHKNEDFSDIEDVEFFLGHHWGNQIFKASREGNIIGIRASAYGPFLALGRITFKDGETIIINRYIDFEMGFAVKLLNLNNAGHYGERNI